MYSITERFCTACFEEVKDAVYLPSMPFVWWSYWAYLQRHNPRQGPEFQVRLSHVSTIHSLSNAKCQAQADDITTRSTTRHVQLCTTTTARLLEKLARVWSFGMPSVIACSSGNREC